jgi:hypothetical protein
VKRLIPAYTAMLSPWAIFAEFKVDFQGPGFYLSPTNTMLVVPDCEYGEEVTWDSRPGTVYDVYVWDCPYEQTLFAALTAAPVRADTREIGKPRE